MFNSKRESNYLTSIYFINKINFLLYVRFPLNHSRAPTHSVTSLSVDRNCMATHINRSAVYLMHWIEPMEKFCGMLGVSVRKMK